MSTTATSTVSTSSCITLEGPDGCESTFESGDVPGRCDEVAVVNLIEKPLECVRSLGEGVAVQRGSGLGHGSIVGCAGRGCRGRARRSGGPVGVLVRRSRL